MTLQRYVSEELTHFVGRGLPEEEQYLVLVNAILKSGWLRHSPGQEAQEPQEALKGGGIGGTIDYAAPIERMYIPHVVCFCDIPVSDFEVHMRKYSRFGLSFLKIFLIEKGANPVFYIAKDAQTMAWFVNPEADIPASDTVPRGLLFERNLAAFHNLIRRLVDGSHPMRRDSLLESLPNERLELSMLRSFLGFAIFNHLKFFDAATADEDPENYYMEREWRVLGDINFRLEDVHRVIIPEAYGKRLRDDLPGYTGQVTFV